jgi:ribosomal protein S6--L-glutamate ligase
VDRIVVLSRKEALYSTRRLVEATAAAGAEALVLDTLSCAMVVAPGASRLLYRGEEVTRVTAVIPRIGASVTGYGIAVVSQFEAMDVRVLNSARGISRSRDKLRCLQNLAHAGIDVPRTAMANRGARAEQLVEQVGGLPCIIKLLRGTQGVGVMLATTLAEAKTILQTFWGLGQDVCLQELVRESRGRDVRALVVGDRVVAAMQRRARRGEFRSNLHRGGRGRVLEPDAAYAATAVAAAQVIGLEVCGVDMLEGSSGPRVIELNSSPGFEGLERATGRDIAAAIVAHALRPAPGGR